MSCELCHVSEADVRVAICVLPLTLRGESLCKAGEEKDLCLDCFHRVMDVGESVAVRMITAPARVLS